MDLECVPVAGPSRRQGAIYKVNKDGNEYMYILIQILESQTWVYNTSKLTRLLDNSLVSILPHSFPNGSNMSFTHFSVCMYSGKLMTAGLPLV